MRLPMMLVLAAVAAAGCEKKTACTLIGCSDQASISLSRADDVPPPGVTEVDVDGRKVTCPTQQSESTCAPDVRISLRAIDVCGPSTSTSSSPTCHPSGRFTEVITISGTPSHVVVTLSTGAQRAFDLSYSSSRPNGAGCDPLCRQANVDWQLESSVSDGGTGDAPGPDAAADQRADTAIDQSADTAIDQNADTAIDQRPDAGSDGAALRCGTTSCAAGEVCVRRQVVGGACFTPGDASCPPGFSAGSPCCVPDPSYRCAPRPAACGTGLDCACASATLCGSGFNCGTSGDEIRCTLLAP
jgi:hypothetical protein